MKCWKCGKDIDQAASQCMSCGADLRRSEPKTEIGAALRRLYDHYGCEELLTNPILIVNGLGDLVQDSEKFRNQLKMALDAGIGKAYLSQIQSVGQSDSAFEKRIRQILLEKAELSEPAAKRIILSLEEMIGWGKVKSTEPVSFSQHEKKQDESSTQQEISMSPVAKKKRPKYPIVIICTALVVVGLIIANQTNGWVPVPWATATPSPTSTIVPGTLLEIKSAYWDINKDTVAVQWSSDSRKGTWEIYYTTGDAYSGSEILEDSGNNTTYLDQYGLIPGKDVEITFKYKEKEDGEFVAYPWFPKAKCTVPISSGMSNTQIMEYNIPPISVAKIRALHTRLDSGASIFDEQHHFFEETEKPTILFSPARELNEWSRDLRFAVYSPDGKLIYSLFRTLLTDFDKLNEPRSADDISEDLAFMFGYNNAVSVFVPGEYKMECYQWHEKKLIGECRFTITE